MEECPDGEKSYVLSGVSQGSVVDRILFLIFFNNLDVQAALITVIKKFADHTKLGQIVKSDKDRAALQQCLDQMTEWADTWVCLLMSKNVWLCTLVQRTQKAPTT
jgi:hypothetical protein